MILLSLSKTKSLKPLIMTEAAVNDDEAAAVKPPRPESLRPLIRSLKPLIILLSLAKTRSLRPLIMVPRPSVRP